MDSERTHIVRLSARVPATSGSAVRLAAPASVRPAAVVRLDRSASVVRPEVDLRAPSKHRTPVRHHHRAKRGSFGCPMIVFRVVTMLLLPVFFAHPLMPVYAADEAVADVPTPAADVTVPASDPAPQADPAPTVTETPAAESDPALSSDSAASDPTSQAQPESTPADDASGGTVAGASATGEETPDTAADATPTTGDTESTPPADTGDANPGNTASEGSGASTDDTTASSTESLADGAASTTPDVASSTDAVASDDPALSVDTASTTEVLEEAAPDVPVEVPVVESPEQIVARLLAEREGVLRNQLRKEVEAEFTKGCVTMDKVGYYCLKEGTSATLGTAPSASVTSVSVAPGTTVPYNQIVMVRGTESVELTQDPWDSAFPILDLSGRTVVWQGNVNDRWQIFFADVSSSSTPTVIQVTHSAESNFNPRVEGNTIVWQGWVDGNWEVYLATLLPVAERPSVDTPLSEEQVRLGIDHAWKVERITDNDTHDMFPSIAGGLLTWQSFVDGNWQIYVFNQKTGTTARLSADGAKSEHPRFSITWDERDKDGHVRMMGYDIATGKVVDITNEARQLPDGSAPYQPPTPITQTDQAALPSTASGSSTPSRTDDGDGADDNALDV